MPSSADKFATVGLVLPVASDTAAGFTPIKLAAVKWPFFQHTGPFFSSKKVVINGVVFISCFTVSLAS